ncbi:1-acyl-sn-glycerol-3-phosphate acyltransferase [Kocuria subflava]|uniref:1-acyl-sn-glycerol-3-phosphate acyltransferase n=1 Tax=Kocuria subflava TaxID=1736139 RepID=A0A846TL35_9MICC|nr:1-acyl-sn-glycerol-3-phosphate acyltransferase [Kocuria subflava]
MTVRSTTASQQVTPGQPPRRDSVHITPLVRLVATVVVPVYRLLGRTKFEGLENLPRTGAFVVTPNHTSEMDAMTVAMPLYQFGVNPTFLAKDSLFKVPVLGTILRRTAQVPVHRGTADSVKALSAAQKHVAGGGSVIIYPEGTLTRDPELWPMHGFPGAARLALAMEIPVIPVGHWGDEQILGRGPDPQRKRWFRPWPRKTVRVKFGPPVDLSRWAPSSAELDSLPGEQRLASIPQGKTVAATNAIMDAITELVAELRGEQPPQGRWDRRRAERR